MNIGMEEQEIKEILSKYGIKDGEIMSAANLHNAISEVVVINNSKIGRMIDAELGNIKGTIGSLQNEIKKLNAIEE